ncbi:hypothetical protein TNCV_4735161 [Trichonephila clavipes]|nr:hypothetical protein TNCV_4735161 [Trichonephila clavipes]
MSRHQHSTSISFWLVVTVVNDVSLELYVQALILLKNFRVEVLMYVQSIGIQIPYTDMVGMLKEGFQLTCQPHHLEKV